MVNTILLRVARANPRSVQPVNSNIGYPNKTEEKMRMVRQRSFIRCLMYTQCENEKADIQINHGTEVMNIWSVLGGVSYID